MIYLILCYCRCFISDTIIFWPWSGVGVWGSEGDHERKIQFCANLSWTGPAGVDWILGKGNALALTGAHVQYLQKALITFLPCSHFMFSPVCFLSSFQNTPCVPKLDPCVCFLFPFLFIPPRLRSPSPWTRRPAQRSPSVNIKKQSQGQNTLDLAPLSSVLLYSLLLFNLWYLVYSVASQSKWWKSKDSSTVYITHSMTF